MTRDELSKLIGAAGDPWPGSTKRDQGNAVLEELKNENITLIDTSPEGVERMADAAFPMEFVPGMDRNIVVHAIRAALESGKVK